MIRARLTDRYGAFVGYCDVPEQTAKDLPTLPEVIAIHKPLSDLDCRLFVRDPRGDATVSIREIVAGYREVTFDWGANFRGTAVPVETPRPSTSAGS